MEMVVSDLRRLETVFPDQTYAAEAANPHTISRSPSGLAMNHEIQLLNTQGELEEIRRRDWDEDVYCHVKALQIGMDSLGLSVLQNHFLGWSECHLEFLLA